MNTILKKLWRHIPLERKKQISLTLILIIITSITEVMSIGAVIPFLGVLANPEAVFEHKFASGFIGLIGINNPSELILPFTMIFVFAALIAGFMRIVLLFVLTRLSHGIGADFNRDIYHRTLSQPYSTHISRNSSEIIAGISAKADVIVTHTIMPSLVMISSIVMILIILSALIFINPLIATISLIGFSLIYLTFGSVVRKKLLKNSQYVDSKTTLVVKILQEGIGSIRDVLIDGTQNEHVETFAKADFVKRKALISTHILGQTPRYGVETFGMILIAFIAYFMSSDEGGISSILPILGALAIGMQRMLPMAQQAYSAWSSIRGSNDVIKSVTSLLEQPLPKYKSEDSRLVPFQSVIKLNNIGFQYNSSKPWVLKDVSLDILKGSKVGIIGSTGCGKSTLLDILMLLLFPTKGSLVIDGVKITEKNYRGWQNHIAHIPQSIFLTDASITENIALGIPNNEIDHEKVKNVAKIAQIDDAINKMDKKYHTIVGERGVQLSGGQRQRIGIARALYKNADVLILDEATSALDNKTEMMVMDAINSLSNQITVLIVAHRQSTLKGCDTIIELERGKVKNIGSYSNVIDNI